ncbi:MAG: hypothetical protein ACJ79A_03540 [Gemmatimonadaceae bacterium]
MEPDFGIIIGLIAAICSAGVLGLSYLGAYFLGHSRGRREAELDQRALDQEMLNALPGDRTAAIEGALSTMAQAIERLTDAQRIALLDRVRTGSDPRPPGGRVGHNTPA